MEAEGHSVHDEADFVSLLCGTNADASVLDAGCGTGRVAAELARRGLNVTGVDNDTDMLAYAAKKPEPVAWKLGDLATIDLDQRFDVVVMAGNILTFVQPAFQRQAIANLARHLERDGLLVIGSGQSAGCSFADVDGWCHGSGLQPVDAFATWDRQPLDGGDYRVSVHQRA